MENQGSQHARYQQTVVNKLNETSEFSVSEALSIRDKFFPSLRIAYLFASDGDQREKPANPSFSQEDRNSA